MLEMLLHGDGEFLALSFILARGQRYTQIMEPIIVAGSFSRGLGRVLVETCLLSVVGAEVGAIKPVHAQNLMPRKNPPLFFTNKNGERPSQLNQCTADIGRPAAHIIHHKTYRYVYWAMDVHIVQSQKVRFRHVPIVSSHASSEYGWNSNFLRAHNKTAEASVYASEGVEMNCMRGGPADIGLYTFKLTVEVGHLSWGLCGGGKARHEILIFWRHARAL
jgi:hypothetical protein